MLKRLRSGIVILSLLLCLAMLAVWVRSHFFGDSVVYSTAKERSLSVMSQPGCMLWSFGWTTREPVAPGGLHWRDFEWGSIPETPPDSPVTYGPVEPYWPEWVHFGFGAHSEVQTINPSRIRNYDGKDLAPYQFHYLSVAFPHWLAALLLALPPGWRAYVLVRARRRKTRGMCPTCGYDLRGGHEKCPECGSPILRLLLKLLRRWNRATPPVPPLAA